MSLNCEGWARLERRLGTLPEETMAEIRRALAFALDLKQPG
jgi:mRNA-degrading endonuclease toxin of MazEF toxin-antitoxin module